MPTAAPTQAPVINVMVVVLPPPPPRHRLFLVFREPELRPPVYDEMLTDMTHVIHKSVEPYVDPSCVELHHDELVAGCWAKTTEMVHRGLIIRCRTRLEFFKQYKTAILNHIRSLVQKHRFTEKRTGVKPPPKDQRNIFTNQSTKPKEIRIDDPDSGFQVADIDSGNEAMVMRELMEEINLRLNWAERIVLEQLVSPNEEALHYARMDAEIGRKDGDPLSIRIRQEHLAKGIGEQIKPELFQEIHDSIKAKCLFMKSQHEDDPNRAAAMATLLQFFGIQIPNGIDSTTRKRTLMLAAQHQFDRLKDDDGIKEALVAVGVPVPCLRNDRFKCFGIMFQKHHRTCDNCGLRESCELKAANFGLGEFTISHKLLGSRHARVPVLQPTRSLQDSAISESMRDEEILAFLDEHFKLVRHQGDNYYRHKDRLEKKGMQFIFSTGRQEFRLRFINPTDVLKKSLVLETSQKGGKSLWFLPGQLSSEEAINLIRAHAQATFVNE
jgi:hypothetical protein